MPLHEVTDNKNAANGYAPLGADSKVPPANLPNADAAARGVVLKSAALADQAAVALTAPVAPSGADFISRADLNLALSQFRDEVQTAINATRTNNNTWKANQRTAGQMGV